MAHSINVLKNGLKIIYVPRKNFSSTVLRFLIPAGSFLDIKNEGLSHLVEHVVTRALEESIHKNSRTTWVGNHLITHFESGVNHRYAYFHFDVFWKDVSLVADAFYDVFTSGVLSSQDVQKEKKIILSEIRDSSEYRFEKSLKYLLKNHFGPSHPVLGKAPSVRKITSRQVNNFFSRHYKNTGMVIVIAGRVTPSMRKILEGAFCKIPLLPYHDPSEKSVSNLKSDAYITNALTRQSYCTAFYPVRLDGIDDIHLWGFIEFILYDYLRYILRERGSMSYSVSAYLDDMWKPSLFRVGFSTNVKNLYFILKLWNKALLQFKEVFTSQEYDVALDAYLKEWELNTDYPVTQAKKIGHYAMLFDADFALRIVGSSPKKFFSRETVSDKIVSLAKNVKFIHIDGPRKLASKKALLSL